MKKLKMRRRRTFLYFNIFVIKKQFIKEYLTSSKKGQK